MYLEYFLFIRSSFHLRNLLSIRFGPYLMIGSVLNVFGRLAKLDLIDTLCKSKRTETLIAAGSGRTEIDKHQSFTITAEAVL
jgi:hypothetical protein